MRGLDALLRLRRVAEDKALRALICAQRAVEELTAEERELRARSLEATDELRRREEEKSGIRQSIVYRRYLSALRSRVARVRQRVAEAQEQAEQRRTAYQQSLHEREAVGELIRRRRERARQEEKVREERVAGDMAQNAWKRSAGAQTAAGDV